MTFRVCVTSAARFARLQTGARLARVAFDQFFGHPAASGA